MPHYKVTWIIDITADTPREAAEYALEIQQDPCSTATYFTVKDVDAGTEVGIDLEDRT